MWRREGAVEAQEMCVCVGKEEAGCSRQRNLLFWLAFFQISLDSFQDNRSQYLASDSEMISRRGMKKAC